ncbi:MAG: hypothetical protein ABIC57_02840 [bacterium]
MDWNNIIGDINPPDGVPTGNEGVVAIIGRVLDVGYAVAGVATVALLILSGIKMIMSEGDPDKLREAKDTLSNAILGIFIVLVSGLIFQFIGRLLGVESLITWFDFNLS